ncbi:MAG: hypothetical protein HY275_10050 [Gemmatimonadetes bacterium]|nr:hypothetical protein [Gemmatimonadota bacterium]
MDAELVALAGGRVATHREAGSANTVPLVRERERPPDGIAMHLARP